MTNKEAKALATEIVGDGKTPNKFFVTCGPNYYEVDEYGDREAQILDGFEDDDQAVQTRVFDSFEEAEDYYEDLELDIYTGVGQVFIEDRLTGVIKEKALEKVVKVDYSMLEYDDSKRFGYKK